MRDMGTRAGVPIEPPEQTALINACVAQAGVIAGGVPGGLSPPPPSRFPLGADSRVSCSRGL